ncbi:MAG TPA: response regulator [Candidatus Omnitrophota bacterium]|nr:response regulator [Candidatus Omnitrophota bacterium]HOX10104.1 response regulator [Candidatus Omnitrophota bacterium]HPN66316.1 response regulator [Candidatus Omnitrophota bacterium]HRZ67781.1 response regulator [Candidatus Omnitrophota bacterium]
MARILIVDDDVEFGIALSKTLKGEGHETATALNTAEGLECLRKEKYDIVFADLSMPGDNGLVLLEKSKKEFPGLPVVMITAFGDWDTYAKALEKSVSKFVNKPVKKEEIMQILKDVLG